MLWLIVGETGEILVGMSTGGAFGIRRSNGGGDGFEEEMVEQFGGRKKGRGRERREEREKRGKKEKGKVKWGFWVKFLNL